MGAQDPAGAVAFAGIIFLIWLIVVIGLYVYYAICLSTIAKRTATENPWLAWIPIANVVLMLQIAKKPVWWIILAFIPIVNIVWIVLMIIVWMAIAERVGKPNWWGILIILPFLNFIVPGYLAFSKSDNPIAEKVETI